MRKSIAILLITLLFASTSYVWAGTTGKIAGTITDKQSGESLVGANVVLLGTTLGASTNLDGAYFVLNIPPGHYSLRVSYIGYQTTTMELVVVKTDLTTRIDVAIEAGIAGEVDFGERIMRYELKYGHEHHDHLICLKCGKYIEAMDPKIERLQKRLCERFGFIPQKHRMEIFGVCKECQKKG